MLSKEKRAAFNSIMGGYTLAPQFDTRVKDLDGFDETLADSFHRSDRDFEIDDEEFAEGYGLPIAPFTEEDLRFLRDFILSTALYVEQLEAFVCDSSDDFWEAREHAYRIITALLIRQYEYELEG
jgi:hypothetical protein